MKTKKIYVRDSLGRFKKDRNIIHWTIKITWSCGEEEYLDYIPDWVAGNVDNYLDEYENL